MLQAERSHASNEHLAAQNFISGTGLDNSRATLETARAALAAAQAARAVTQVAQRDASLTAPIAGIVAKRPVLPGEKVSVEQQVLTQVDLARLELAGTVGTHAVARLRPGLLVQFQGEGLDAPLTGELARIAPAAEAGTRSIGATVALANPGERLRAGQYALARVVLADPPLRLVLPLAAVGTTSGQSFVWLIDPGALVRRAVTLGRREEAGGRVEVLSGVSCAMQEVRGRLSAVQGGLPRDAKPPTVARFNNDNAQPVMVLVLLSPTRSARELSLNADQQVDKRLQRAEGVARVEVSGLASRELRIDLDPARLRSYAVTLAEVASALREANAEQPLGLLSDRTQDALLRVEGWVRDPRDFARIVVARRAGLALTLGDLGPLVEREKEADSMAHINGQRAASFDVFKQQDANIVAAGDAAKAAMDELRKTLPPDVELRLVYANSDWVKQSLDGLKRMLVEGALLTVAIVFLFLHRWRSTVITGLTLPISVIARFIAVHAFGFALNFMTMMALSLCIGLLIDDAIVVRDGYRAPHRHGQAAPPSRAGGHRRDRPGGAGHHLRTVRGVRAGGLQGRHHRQVLLPIRHHGGGGGAGQPVRQLHAQPKARQASSPSLSNGTPTTVRLNEPCRA